MAAKKKNAKTSSAAKSNTRNNSRTAKPRSSGTKANPKGRAVKEEKRGLSPRIKSLIYCAAAAIILCFIIFNVNTPVFHIIRGFLFGMFGVCCILLPIMLVYLAVITGMEKEISHHKAKVFLLTAIFLLADALIYFFAMNKYTNLNYFSAMAKLFTDSASSQSYFTSGGGFVSGILGYPLMLAFDRVVGTLITSILLTLLILIITGISIRDIGNAAKKVGKTVSHAYEKSGEYIHNAQRKSAERKARKIENTEHSPDTRIDIPLDNGVRKIKPDDRIDIALDNEGTAEKPSSKEELLNIMNLVNGKDKKEVNASEIAKDISETKKKSHKKPPKEEKKAEKAKPDEETFEAPETTAQSVSGDYAFPPAALLRPGDDENSEKAMNEMSVNAQKLVDTLNSFGVKASITNICRGPSVTRYELAPAPGVKISKITNLSDDIALNLAANGVRIEAPIPGKAAVGIEVPNKFVSMVTMRDLIDSPQFKQGKSKLTCVLGEDISGEIVVTDLAKMPHLLIAGTTGSGKSVCVNSILLSILFKATPDEVKLLLIDPKMVEFSKYKGIPHLLVPVVSDAKKAAGALNWAVSEMLQRYKLFSEYDCKDIHSYNKLIQRNLEYIEKTPTALNDEGEEYQPVMEVNGLPVAKEKLPQIVIAIDELADLMMAAPGEVEDAICRLAQMARAAGMHLVIATQRPSVNVITGVIKANIPSRIALKVSSNIDSRTILDYGGAEKLIGRGDMLFSPVGAPKPIRVQGCYASDEEIESVTGYIKKSHDARYNAEIEEKIKKIAAEDINSNSKDGRSSSDNSDSEYDDKIEEAIKCVIDAGQASTSLLQRKLKVGYARAGRMVDELEQMGIVGPHQGSKPREVLMTYNEWLERSNLLGDSLHTESEEDDFSDDYD